MEGNVMYVVVVSGLFQCTRLPLALGLKTVLGSLIPFTVVLPGDIGLETPYEPSLWTSPSAPGQWVGTSSVALARRLTGSNLVLC